MEYIIYSWETDVERARFHVYLPHYNAYCFFVLSFFCHDFFFFLGFLRGLLECFLGQYTVYHISVLTSVGLI